MSNASWKADLICHLRPQAEAERVIVFMPSLFVFD